MLIQDCLSIFFLPNVNNMLVNGYDNLYKENDYKICYRLKLVMIIAMKIKESCQKF